MLCRIVQLRNTSTHPTAIDLHALGVAAVDLASVVLMQRFRSPDLQVSVKSSAADVVTDADLASERIVREHILSSRPDDGFIGEEGTSVPGTSGLSWILDPIDSTANYARGIPIWSISLAVSDESGVIAGVVACPPLDEVISATSETGVLLNGSQMPPPPRRELDAAMVAIGWGPKSGGERQARVASTLIPAVGKVRSPGSPALGLAWTALGRFDAAFYEMDFSQWDVAAGGFLCECAGLRVTRRDPERSGESPRLLASPEHLEPSLREFVFG